MKTKAKKNILSLCLLFVLALSALQGCGTKAVTQEELLADMKEFSTPDKSVFIHLNKAWSTMDVGVDTFLTAANAKGNESALILQFPKNSIYSIASMDDLKASMQETYSITEPASEESFEVPGMSNVELISCKVSAEGQTSPAYLLYGETEYAFYSIAYLSNKLTDTVKSSFQASCSTFREEIPEVEDSTTVELTDTIRWMNASYAILTELNGWDYNRFAGMPANNSSMVLNQNMLIQSWDVTDRASAEETLDWILSEGHRADFADNMSYLEEAGLTEISADQRVAFITENFELSEEEAKNYASWYSMYEEFGASAIDGWDYCRAMNLLSFFYLAGYYTEQEALDTSLEIAQTVQPLFDSWDALVDSYLRGYEYWAEESSEERRAVYEDLKSRSDSPYQVDFKITLEKTW